MSDRENGKHKSRAQRDAAKHKPHRTKDRFYKAKHDAQHACEDLRAKIQRSNIHDAVRHELLRAVDAAGVSDQRGCIDAVAPGFTPARHHGTSAILQVAETWLAAADRVLGRLGPDGPRSSRVAIDEAVDTVMWHIRPVSGTVV